MSTPRDATVANEPEQVVWTRIPIIGLPELACCVPVTPDGRALDDAGEPLPMEERTRKCGEDGVWMLGMCAMCRPHAEQVAVMTGDTLAAIEAAWREIYV